MKSKAALNSTLNRLRISTLPSDWNIVEIGNIASVNEATLPESTLPDYSFKYVDLGAVKEGVIQIPEEETRFSDAPLRARRILRRGDVLMSTVRPYLRGFAVADFDTERIVCSTGFALITPKSSVDSQFIYQSLSGETMMRQFSELLAGSNYPALNSSQVQKLLLVYPSSTNERASICKVLSAWDNAVNLTTKLIDAKNGLKNGLVQHLLWNGSGTARTRQVKFAKARLGDILELALRPVPKPNRPYTSLGLRSHCKGTFLRIVERPESVMMDTLYEVKENDLILNITFAWEGAIAFAKPDDANALVSHRFPTYVVKNDEIDLEFLKQVLLTRHFVFQLGLISPGGAGRNRVLSKRDFLELEINVPDLENQRQIATILHSIDEEIRLSKALLAAVKLQKQGLRYDLLTGRKRVRRSPAEVQDA